MTHSQILILEKKPFWHSELQRAFKDSSIQIKACHSFAQMEEFYTNHRNHAEPLIGIIDIEFNPAECLLFLGNNVVNTSISTIIIGLPKSSDLEWTLRELGVVQILPKPFSNVQLIESCKYIIQKSTKRLSH